MMIKMISMDLKNDEDNENSITGKDIGKEYRYDNRTDKDDMKDGGDNENNDDDDYDDDNDKE